ncbi:MAG: IS91 family transposase, partial [Spirochaetota bacterium]
MEHECLIQTKPPYKPGVRRWSLYKSLWLKYWPEFESSYEEKYSARYGHISPEKHSEVTKLLECGVFSNGFVSHECSQCGTKIIIPFTCKSRLCVSCRSKSLFSWSLNLSQLMDMSLRHVHVTFTLPGGVNKMIEHSGFKEEDLMPLAASVYQNFMRMSMWYDKKKLMPGMVTALHLCGNSLNYNPHVHLVGTLEMVHVETGEILSNHWLHYAKARFLWRNAVCSYLLKKQIITQDQSLWIKDKYRDGFNVHVRHLEVENNEMLGRTAEYIASGYFHNSQIEAIDHRRKTVTFSYKKHVDAKTGAKSYSRMTMPIYDFLAKMLYFLPDKNRKMIRYYGIYANGVRQKMENTGRATWKKGIEHTFDGRPEVCPRCGSAMLRRTVYHYAAVREMKKIWRT